MPLVYLWVAQCKYETSVTVTIIVYSAMTFSYMLCWQLLLQQQTNEGFDRSSLSRVRKWDEKVQTSDT